MRGRRVSALGMTPERMERAASSDLYRDVRAAYDGLAEKYGGEIASRVMLADALGRFVANIGLAATRAHVADLLARIEAGPGVVGSADGSS